MSIMIQTLLDIAEPFQRADVDVDPILFARRISRLPRLQHVRTVKTHYALHRRIERPAAGPQQGKEGEDGHHVGLTRTVNDCRETERSGCWVCRWRDRP